MTFKYTVALNDPTNSSLDAALIADTESAAAEWSAAIYGLGSIDIQVNVTPTTRANGAPTTSVAAGKNAGLIVYQAGSASELLTGVDPNGSAADITINVDPTYLANELYLNPNTAAPDVVPKDRADGTGVLAHEIGHGLGITGYRDENTGSLPGYESPWDRLVVLNSDGTADFVGQNAEAVYGGPVPVTTLKNGEQYNHLGDGSDPASSDLMNGIATDPGQNYAVSDLDLGVMKDLGLTVYGSSGGDPLVDAIYYHQSYPDLSSAHVEAAAQYQTTGWREGRNPDPLFDTTGYLATNPDVLAGGVDPLTHYESFGWKEGRDPSASFSTDLYLLHNPDVAAAGVGPLVHYLEYGQYEGRQTYAAVGRNDEIGDFDPEYYLLSNPDVAAAAEKTANPDQFALQHYETFGWHEGRNPNAYFNTDYYLANNPDVAAGGADPLLHYEQYGWHEGRNPSATFNTDGYLAANADVKNAGVDPLNHFLSFGIWEGRTA